MDKLIVSCILYGIVTVLITENLSMPDLRVKRFLFNCEQKITCEGLDDIDHVEICGSDGQTYNNTCHLNKTNHRNSCEIGNFNLITAVHTGNCTDTEKRDLGNL